MRGNEVISILWTTNSVSAGSFISAQEMRALGHILHHFTAFCSKD
jgi:hypothetical protein